MCTFVFDYRCRKDVRTSKGVAYFRPVSRSNTKPILRHFEYFEIILIKITQGFSAVGLTIRITYLNISCSIACGDVESRRRKESA